jgi:hypothetical protein
MKRLESDKNNILDNKNRILSIREFIDEIRNVMGEDKNISIKFYEDELVFYLFEREVGINLNMYNYNYHPYIDFEGHDGSNARLGLKELKIVYDVMTIIENNLEEVLSWINVKSLD